VREREGDLLVIATGAARTLAEAAPELSVLQPIKGHILQVDASGPVGVTVRGERGYAVPTGDGLAFGATMEPGVDDPSVDPANREPLLDAGAQLFPQAAGAAHRLLAGVRGATPDGLPLVGASATAGVMLAVGARRNGWLLAPMVAGAIAALATGRDPGPFAKRLDPARFTA
jgi:glycine oxidase